MKSIGIDYHKRYSVLCIVDETGAELHMERIEHAFPERFEALLKAYTPCQVAFEATMNLAGCTRILRTSLVLSVS